ncbi:MAG: hypothetical protein MZV63_14425, partial [Marinilabiliales bacterium]|nr:hypothetical protein [Marinilabiliales bacterium]
MRSSEADLKEFGAVGKNYTPESMAAYQNRWAVLIDEVKAKVGLDPSSRGPGSAGAGRPFQRGLRRTSRAQAQDRRGLPVGGHCQGAQHDRPRSLGLHQEGPRGRQDQGL